MRAIGGNGPDPESCNPSGWGALLYLIALLLSLAISLVGFLSAVVNVVSVPIAVFGVPLAAVVAGGCAATGRRETATSAVMYGSLIAGVVAASTIVFGLAMLLAREVVSATC